MFNQQRTETDTLPEPKNDPVPLHAEAMVSGSAAPLSTTGSVIGSDLMILGERLQIISQDVLQIDGDVQGDVSGRRVTIGPDGSVTGTISSEHVDVFGGIRGAVRAGEVVLHPSSHVDGEIVHQSLSVAAGASFEGRVRRAKDKDELTPDLNPQARKPEDKAPLVTSLLSESTEHPH